MNKKLLKKIGIILAAVVITGLAIGGGIAIVKPFGVSGKVVVPPDNFVIEIQYNDEVDLKQDFVVYDYNKDKFNQVDYHTVKNGVLHIENKLEEITAVTVWVEEAASKDIIFSTTLAGIEKKDVDFSEFASGVGDYRIFYAIEKGDVIEYFVNSEASFKHALEQVQPESDSEKVIITMISDITYDLEADENITISEGFTWNTGGYTFTSDKMMVFSGEDEDIMYINNHSPEAVAVGGIVCETPLWTYEMTHVFDNFAEEKFYYIYAAKVNNKAIDTSTMYVDSAEKLNRILSDRKLNIPESTHTIVLGSDMYLETLTGIIIDEPELNIVWEGTYAFSNEEANQFFNVKTYNGTERNAYMGGTGLSKFQSGTIGGIELTLDGNTLNALVGYADNFNIKKAKIDSVVTEGGTGEIVSEGDNYYYVVTDAASNTYGYKINVELKSYSLPVIYINTDSGKAVTSKEDYVGGTVTVDYNGYVGSGGFDVIADEIMNIRGRGNSSWKLDKKPYKIKFESKTSLFGLTESKEWVLLANHADQSLIRNNLAMSVGQVLDNMLFTPHSYMVDVYVNGTYAGVYSLSEQIEVKEGRIEGEKDSMEVDTDYLLEWNGSKATTSFGHNIISSPLCSYVAVIEPDEKVLTYEQAQYIKNYLREVDAAIQNDDNYEELVDIDSFVDWFILYELSYNTDGMMRRSDFFLKKKGGKLYAAAPWDFDLAFGNFSYDGDYYEQWICLGNPKTEAYKKGPYVKDNWFRYLIKDDEFKAKLKNRWNEIKNELYDEAMSTIDEAELKVLASATENFRTWKILGTRIQAQSKKVAKIDIYQGQLDYLRNYVKNRYNWMDDEINSY